MYYNVFANNPTSNVFSLYQGESENWIPMWAIINSEVDNLSLKLDLDLDARGNIFKVNGENAKIIGNILKDVLGIERYNNKIKNLDYYKDRNDDLIKNYDIKKEYEFDYDLIKQFSYFCINSGGFRVL